MNQNLKDIHTESIEEINELILKQNNEKEKLSRQKNTIRNFRRIKNDFYASKFCVTLGALLPIYSLFFLINTNFSLLFKIIFSITSIVELICIIETTKRKNALNKAYDASIKIIKKILKEYEDNEQLEKLINIKNYKKIEESILNKVMEILNAKIYEIEESINNLIIKENEIAEYKNNTENYKYNYKENTYEFESIIAYNELTEDINDNEKPRQFVKKI